MLVFCFIISLLTFPPSIEPWTSYLIVTTLTNGFTCFLVSSNIHGEKQTIMIHTQKLLWIYFVCFIDFIYIICHQYHQKDIFYPNEPTNKDYNFSLLGIFVSRYETYIMNTITKQCWSTNLFSTIGHQKSYLKTYYFKQMECSCNSLDLATFPNVSNSL